MRKFPKVGDKVHVSHWENVVCERRGLPWPVWEVVGVDRKKRLPIALRHPGTAGHIEWFTRRWILGIVDA